MASKEEMKMFNEITKCGCCKRCALRYLGYDVSFISFEEPENSLLNFELISVVDTIFNNGPMEKRRREAPCSVCLGLLEDYILDALLNNKELSKLNEYNHQNFVLQISFPTCILVREHSMKIHLKRLFPDRFNINNVIKINMAWRKSIQVRLCQMLNKKYHHSAQLKVLFHTKYDLEADEMAVVEDYLKEHHSLSKHYIVDLLENISDKVFETFITIPPKLPLYELTPDNLEIISDPLHLMGQYNKYSRSLPQISPNSDVSSVVNCLSSAIKTVLGPCCREIVSEASLFFDKDIRILGRGQTFHLQLIESKIAEVSQTQCKQIEEIVNIEGQIIIKNLSQTDRKDVQLILDLERSCHKTYKLLCVIANCQNVDHCINILNTHPSFQVTQRTPIKFLHNRIYKIKQKKVLEIKAAKVKDRDNLIELELCVDGGLSIEEFIHGDLGRTRPYLEQIINADISIIAVDIIDFHV